MRVPRADWESLSRFSRGVHELDPAEPCRLVRLRAFLDSFTGRVDAQQLAPARFAVPRVGNRWSQPLDSEPFDVSYASPILIKVDGQDQLVVMSSIEVIGLDPRDGKTLWRHPHANNFKNNCSTPVWGDDNLLLISSHADGGSRVLRLTQKGGKTDLREVWHSKEVRFFHSTPIRIGDFVYGCSGDGPPMFFTAVNVKTGKIAWKERGFNKATCTYADGKMYILDEDGKLTLAKVSPTKLTVISSFKPLEKTAWAAPTIANGRLFVRDQKKVMAFDIPNKR